MSRVPFFDLRVTDAIEKKALLASFEKILDHGKIILGPEVEALEKCLSEYFGGQHVIGVNSGTDALFIGIRALGIGSGDEVIVPSLSWIATANAVRMAGATPVFCEVKEDLNLDVESLKRCISKKTKLLLPVHFTGKMCQMDQLKKISFESGIPIMEDASQAFGAHFLGQRAGTWGRLSALSLNSMKILNSIGEAGICITADEDLNKRILGLRYNGCYDRETCLEPSLNGRIDTIQAAFLLVRYTNVESGIERRREIAKRYSASLSAVATVPVEVEGCRDVYYSYQIHYDRRDALMEHLLKNQIECKVQHRLLMPDQPAYYSDAKGEYAFSREIVKRTLCLPMHEKLTNDQVDHVIDVILKFDRNG